MTSEDYEKRFTILKPVIRNAGKEVKRLRDEGLLTQRIKVDGSPVSSADEWANQFLRNAIEQHFPNEVVIGEEDENKSYPPGTDLVWYIDPIDGTKSYLEGKNDYYVLIGLTYKGIPVFGLHYRPETAELIYGWPGQRPASVNLSGRPSKPMKPISDWSFEPRIYLKSYDIALREAIKSYGVKRARYAPGMVDMVAPLFGMAEGFASYRKSAYWDLAAPAAIMNAAGFRHASQANDLHKTVLFNDGSWNTDFYYNLPPSSPDSFIEHLVKVRREFQTDSI